MDADTENVIRTGVACYRQRRDRLEELSRKLAKLRETIPSAANEVSARIENLELIHQRMTLEFLDELVGRVL